MVLLLLLGCLFGSLKATSDGAVHLDGLKFPDPDYVIGVTSEQGQTIGRPRKTDTVWCGGWFSILVIGNLHFQFLDQLFLFQIPDSDGWAASGAQPVPIWAEYQSTDFVTAFQTVKWIVSGFTEIPKHSFSVLSTASG